MRHFVRALVAMAVLVSMCGTLHASKAQSLTIQWSVDVDQRQPNDPVALSAPVVMEWAQETWVVIGGRDGWVHVYDIHGSEVKRFPLASASDSAAVLLDNGLVVLGDTAGRLYAVDPELGQVVWQTQLTASFTSAPVVVEHGFIVQTTDSRLYCFSAEGEKLWSYAGPSSVLSMYLSASPLVVGDRVYALFGSGDAVALHRSTGDLLWKRQLLLSNNGAVLSELKAPLATPLFVSALQMGGEDVERAVLLSFFHGETVALSAKGGVQYFSLPLSLKSSPVVMSNVLYAADSEGMLHAYDIEHGERLWSKKVSEGELMGPVAWQNTLWLTNQQGQVYQVSLGGDVQAKIQLAGHVARLPVVTKTGLLVRSERGAMYMVSP